ncbi:MAG: hypothetical protein U1A73_18195 [Pseudomonas sp.]|nr:hypothetical protein [Pseudomonas sp.]
MDERVDRRRWLAFSVLLVGAVLRALDRFIFNVALPFMRSGPGANSAEVQLLISGYAGACAVFLNELVRTVLDLGAAGVSVMAFIGGVFFSEAGAQP